MSLKKNKAVMKGVSELKRIIEEVETEDHEIMGGALGIFASCFFMTNKDLKKYGEEITGRQFFTELARSLRWAAKELDKAND